MKKFDIIFSNPPYTKNLDLKILKTLFENKVSNNIIFVHPSSFLLDKKFKTNLYNLLRNNNHLEQTELFWGNNLFNINLTCPACITVWNTKKNTNTCQVIDNAFTNNAYICQINDISLHPQYILQWFKQLNIKESLSNHLTPEDQLTDYSIKFSLVRGHALITNSKQTSYLGFNDDIYTLLSKNIENNKCDHTFRWPKHVFTKLHWSFNSEVERENFIKYCKTKFVRFLLSFVKMGLHLDSGELDVIPWLDFTQEWNNKKLCEKFNISKELWEYIDKFIPNYYDDYDD